MHDPARWSDQEVFAKSRVQSGRVRTCSNSQGSSRIGPGIFHILRVGSGRVGSDRVGSGRVGSGRVGSGRVGSGRVGSRRLGSSS